MQASPKYSHPEIERRWLVPHDVALSLAFGRRRLIEDRYIQGTNPIPGAAGFLLNGEEVEDVGDAEVYTHAAEEVAEFSKLLAATTPRDLLDRYDSVRMKALEIYPESDWDQGAFDYLLEYYNRLRPFIQRHADLGHELMVMIC